MIPSPLYFLGNDIIYTYNLKYNYNLMFYIQIMGIKK